MYIYIYLDIFQYNYHLYLNTYRNASRVFVYFSTYVYTLPWRVHITIVSQRPLLWNFKSSSRVKCYPSKNSIFRGNGNLTRLMPTHFLRLSVMKEQNIYDQAQFLWPHWISVSNVLRMIQSQSTVNSMVNSFSRKFLTLKDRKSATGRTCSSTGFSIYNASLNATYMKVRQYWLFKDEIQAYPIASYGFYT